MPPKKPAAPEKKAILGRPSNNLKIGIVGLPNVGKSSFFNVLSKTGAHLVTIVILTDINSSICHHQSHSRLGKGGKLSICDHQPRRGPYRGS
jgi:ribosome biogenesis GTPase A